MRVSRSSALFPSKLAPRSVRRSLVPNQPLHLTGEAAKFSNLRQNYNKKFCIKKDISCLMA